MASSSFVCLDLKIGIGLSIFMKNKLCGTCGREMQRWGKTAAGTPRYRCFACKKSSTIHRDDTRLRHEKDRFTDWLAGVESASSIAKRFGITRQGLWKEF